MSYFWVWFIAIVLSTELIFVKSMNVFLSRNLLQSKITCMQLLADILLHCLHLLYADDLLLLTETETKTCIKMWRAY